MNKRIFSLITAAALLLPQAAAVCAGLDKPDSVADYLCIGSQYTNKTYGSDPNGRIVSLGNFGGYITYYYNEPITDDSRNLYGIDFYVIGNSEEVNIDSLAEPGQVYVSEDGEEWYALAGSEHYEDTALWDYTITYARDDEGNSSWSDNYGNVIDYPPASWPDPDIYGLNNVGSCDSYSFTGILLKSQQNTITGSGNAGTYSAKVKFGYADYYGENIKSGELIETNPYISSPACANGFDLAWAVDNNGLPIDVSGKEFHYVKIATASNIYAGPFKEKSTEITHVIRTPHREIEVGKTDAPNGVIISDGETQTTVEFTGEQSIYDVTASKNCTVSVIGSAENVYINNLRSDTASGFPKGLVRIITQSGNMEPSIRFLRFTAPNATDEPEIPQTEAPAPTDAPQTETPQPTPTPRAASSSNISVSFTLYGDERHGEGKKHTYKNDRYSLPIWIKTKTYIVPTGSTVFDVFAAALNEAGISWEKSGNNYICAVNGLSEFDNGETSGWMYLLNGNHTESGVSDQTVKNGDRIIFHYTDDYTAEQGSENFVSRSSRSAATATPAPTQSPAPTAAPTETPYPTEAPIKYTDVDYNGKYAKAIRFVTDTDLFNGVTDTEFAPDAPMTRAMLITVLYRFDGKPGTLGDTPFTDTVSGEYYIDALKWAYKNGIINGVTDTMFAPDSDILNEHAALIIRRYLTYAGYNLDSFSKPDFYIYNVTRAEIADLFMRLNDFIR